MQKSKNNEVKCEYEIGQCLSQLETNPAEVFPNTTWEHCNAYYMDMSGIGAGICYNCKGKWQRKS